ncbi:MAG: hypothetical protein H6717_41160 [Polyangiaceae bacterium]|nr:hypothetical protein [Polyangiaceae bacterium]
MSFAASLSGCSGDRSSDPDDIAAQSTPVVGASGFDEPDPKTGLLPWASHSFRKRTFGPEELARDAMDNRIQIKFKVGSGVRSRGGKLTIEKDKVEGEPAFKALDAVRATLDKYDHKVSVRMHELSEKYLEKARAEGQARTGRDVPDLNLWFYSYVEPKDAEHMSQLLDELNKNPLVELAYPCFLPVSAELGKAGQKATEILQKAARHAPVPDADRVAKLEKGIDPQVQRSIDPPGIPTPPPAPPGDYSPLQHYAQDWPRGINAIDAQATYFGAYATNTGYGDVEYAWRTTHQDLTSLSSSNLVSGTPHSSINITDFRNHGTAVTGILSAADNGFGVTGLTSEAEVRLSTEFPTTGPNRPAAVSNASANLWPGGAILIEMQTFAGFDCNGDNIAASDYNQASLPDFVPAEHDPAVKDAVKLATANGRHVIATGGNGGCNLDLPGFLGAFAMYDEVNVNASVNAQDSGAVFVGAGGANVPASYWAFFSTYGSRFDAQAQGDSQIVTTGYGDFYNSANAEDTFYTSTFGGTSGAGPIVTGAMVALEGILFNNHGGAFTPKELRRMLRRHSTIRDIRLEPSLLSQNPNGIGTTYIKRTRVARPDLMELGEVINARHFCGRSSDFDGDGKADFALYRTSRGFGGLWKIRYSGGGEDLFQWGQDGDIPCPADIVGDSRAELVVYRPSTTQWLIKNLQNGSTSTITYGSFGDIPIALDFDGDGKANLAVFDRYSYFPHGRWYIRDQTQSATLAQLPVGEFDSTPLTGDLDGDGADDLITFKGGTWEIAKTSNLNFSAFIPFGKQGDIPRIHHDSGGDKLAFFRPDEGKLYLQTGNSTSTSVSFGAPGDIPIFADVSGDATDERILFRAPEALPYTVAPSQPLFYQQNQGVVWSDSYEVTWIPVMR